MTLLAPLATVKQTIAACLVAVANTCLQILQVDTVWCHALLHFIGLRTTELALNFVSRAIARASPVLVHFVRIV